MNLKLGSLTVGKIVAASSLLWTNALFAQVVVAPGAFATTEGNLQYNASPFGGVGGSFAQILYTQAALGLTAGDVITGIAFRLDSTFSPAQPASDGTVTSWAVSIGTPQSGIAPGSMSSDPTLNITGATLVHSGSLLIHAGDYTSGQSPNAFGPVIPLSGYTYNGGSIIIQIQQSGGVPVNIDVSNGAGNLTDYQTKLSNGQATPLSMFDVPTPIVQLSYTPVPEPVTYTLLSALGLGVFALVRGRKH